MQLTNTRLKRIVLCIIVFTIVFIWGNSMLPADASSDESGFVMELITPFLEIYVGKGNVTMYMVRKLAHFTEYFTLGAELSIYCMLIFDTIVRRKKWLTLVPPMAVGILIASIDETIQIFANNRGPSVKDVLLDFSGVCTAVILAWIIRRMLLNEQNKDR